MSQKQIHWMAYLGVAWLGIFYAVFQVIVTIIAYQKAKASMAESHGPFPILFKMFMEMAPLSSIIIAALSIVIMTLVKERLQPIPKQ